MLALYIKTRNWEREERAKLFESKVHSLRIAAAMGSSDDARGRMVTELYESLIDEVQALRRPEGYKERYSLTPQQKSFLHFTGAVAKDN